MSFLLVLSREINTFANHAWAGKSDTLFLLAAIDALLIDAKPEP